MNENQIHHFSMFFNRLPGLWWITDQCLAYWLTGQTLKDIVCAVTCSKEELEQYCHGRGAVLLGNRLKMNCGIDCDIKFKSIINESIIAGKEEKELLKNRKDLSEIGLWQRHIDPILPYKIQLPFRYGTLLDEWLPLWWKDANHSRPLGDGWFTEERKKNAYELIGLMYEYAERVGIRDAMWLGFGGLLGYVMYGDFCPNDTDIDICIMMDKSTPEKDRRYLEEIQKPIKINGELYPHGLCEKMYRFSNFKADENRPLWISIGPKSIKNNGVKSCHWWFFEHSNYYWHSKGDRWVTGKFNNSQINKGDKAVCLGQPSGTLDSFTDVNFHGIAVKMPVKAGTCCDWWYPGWVPGGNGSSLKRRILAVPDWDNKSTWRMM